MCASSRSLEIHSSSGSYTVTVESHSLSRNLAGLPNAAILADEFFRPQLDSLYVSATFIRAVEENKSLDFSPHAIEGLRKAGATRRTELVALGGGILQDLSAFIASIYMRGLTWSYLPTTILAMVDSCIGGKSSINVGPYKNLVGTFHPPRQVLIDPTLALTLPPEQKASGLIEAAKICFCRGTESFARHMALEPSVTMSTDALEALILNSLEAKKWFIEIDEFDRKERLLLNFGHTFGHAMEGATHFAIPHGIAVALGILCAIAFQTADQVSYASAPQVAVLEDHLVRMIHTLPEVSTHLSAMSLDEVLERFASDKKHGSDDFALILIDRAGQVVLRRLPRSAEVVSRVQAAVKSVVERFQRS